MISAVSVAISRSASIGVPAGSAAQRSAVSAAASTMIGANSGRREACTIGATMRRRCRQVSPSLMNSPSPSSGVSACRICGLLRSKLSCMRDKGLRHRIRAVADEQPAVQHAGREELVLEAFLLEDREEVAPRRRAASRAAAAARAAAPDRAARKARIAGARSLRRSCRQAWRQAADGADRAGCDRAGMPAALPSADRRRSRPSSCAGRSRRCGAPVARPDHVVAVPLVEAEMARRPAAGSAGGRRRSREPPVRRAAPARRIRICSISSERRSPSR